MDDSLFSDQPAPASVDPSLFSEAPAPEGSSALEAFGRGALRNFPLAQQITAATTAYNPLTQEGSYGAELSHLTQAADAAKAAHPAAYGAGAVSGSLAPLAIPGIGEALEASPIAANAALGATGAISDSDSWKDAAKQAALGAGIGGALGAAGSALSSKLVNPTSQALNDISNHYAVQAMHLNPQELEGLTDSEISQLGQFVRGSGLLNNDAQTAAELADKMKESVGSTLGEISDTVSGWQKPSRGIKGLTSSSPAIAQADTSPIIDSMLGKAEDLEGSANRQGVALRGAYNKAAEDVANLGDNPSFADIQKLKEQYGSIAFNKYGNIKDTAAGQVANEMYRALSDAQENIIKNVDLSKITDPDERQAVAGVLQAYKEGKASYSNLASINQSLTKLAAQRAATGSGEAGGFGMVGRLVGKIPIFGGKHPVANAALAGGLAAMGHPLWAAGALSPVLANPVSMSDLAATGAKYIPKATAGMQQELINYLTSRYSKPKGYADGGSVTDDFKNSPPIDGAGPNPLDDSLSKAEAFGRGALRNFPLAQQAVASIEPGQYEANLQDLVAKAEASKQQNPLSYGAGAVTGSLAPFAIPGIGDALGAEGMSEQALAGGALGASQNISDTPLNTHNALDKALEGGALGASIGALGNMASSRLAADPLAELANTSAVKSVGVPVSSDQGMFGNKTQELGQWIRKYVAESPTALETPENLQTPLQKMKWRNDLIASQKPSSQADIKQMKAFLDYAQKAGLPSDELAMYAKRARDMISYNDNILKANTVKTFLDKAALAEKVGDLPSIGLKQVDPYQELMSRFSTMGPKMAAHYTPQASAELSDYLNSKFNRYAAGGPVSFSVMPPAFQAAFAKEGEPPEKEPEAGEVPAEEDIFPGEPDLPEEKEEEMPEIGEVPEEEDIIPDIEHIGDQEDGFGGSFPLYNVNIPGHPLEGSTVSADTLKEHGLTPPNKLDLMLKLLGL